MEKWMLYLRVSFVWLDCKFSLQEKQEALQKGDYA